MGIACGTSERGRYYCRFAQDFATVASPLHRLPEAGQPYVWDNACAAAFARLQAALTEAPVLAYPDARRPFIVDTDASNVGYGPLPGAWGGEACCGLLQPHSQHSHSQTITA